MQHQTLALCVHIKHWLLLLFLVCVFFFSLCCLYIKLRFNEVNENKTEKLHAEKKTAGRSKMCKFMQFSQLIMDMRLVLWLPATHCTFSLGIFIECTNMQTIKMRASTFNHMHRRRFVHIYIFFSESIIFARRFAANKKYLIFSVVVYCCAFDLNNNVTCFTPLFVAAAASAFFACLKRHFHMLNIKTGYKPFGCECVFKLIGRYDLLEFMFMSAPSGQPEPNR